MATNISQKMKRKCFFLTNKTDKQAFKEALKHVHILRQKQVVEWKSAQNSRLVSARMHIRWIKKMKRKLYGHVHKKMGKWNGFCEKQTQHIPGAFCFVFAILTLVSLLTSFFVAYCVCV